MYRWPSLGALDLAECRSRTCRPIGPGDRAEPVGAVRIRSVTDIEDQPWINGPKPPLMKDNTEVAKTESDSTEQRPTEPIAFFLPYADDVRDADPHADHGIFTNGATIWIGTTFHELRRRGLPVVLRSDRPQERIVVVHRDHVRSLERTLPTTGRPLVVVVRADRVPHPGADVEIVQNASLRQTPRKRSVTHWPQPGLVPRDPSRGTQISTVVYKGSPKNLHPLFHRESWSSELASLGISWRPDFSIQRTDGVDRSFDASWHDYSDADLVLAVRPDHDGPHLDRPNHKLVNAWRAGAPLIAGPESAYMAARKSDLDFVLVHEPDEVLEEIRQLSARPDRYAAMVEEGHRRAIEYSFDAITAEWTQVLWQHVHQLAVQPESATVRRLRKGSRRLVSVANNRLPPTRRIVSLW